jgi:tetratricopeptide (TPR) repeat protein
LIAKQAFTMNIFNTVASLFVTVLLFLAAGGHAFAQAKATNLESAFEQAVAAHKAGDVAGAVRQYRAILVKQPNRVDVRSNLGAALVQLGQYSDAITEYQRALTADSRNTTIRFNLALAFYKAANFAEAAAELQRVATAQPDNTNALLLQADCRLRLGEHQQVIALLTPLDAQLGTNPIYAYLLGTALLYDKQMDKGQELIDRILRGGDSAEVRVMMGAAHLLTQDIQNALKEFERALALNAKTPTLQALYGRALMQTGETERAAQAFRLELAANPNDFESNLYLGMLLKKEAKNDEALTYLERAARVRPNDVNARYQIGSIYMGAGKVAEAERLLAQLIKEAPDFIEAHVLLATAYYRLKRKAEGDRERAIVEKLTAEKQARQPGAQDGATKPPTTPVPEKP